MTTESSTQPAPDLTGKVAVVTGGSRGIGQGIATELGAAGATVYATGRSGADATVEAIARAGGQAHSVACDHADDDQARALFERVVGEQGGLDVLVNCAATLPSTPEDFARSAQPFWTVEPTMWDQFANVGMRSHYVASALAAPSMVERGGGLIVNISSAAAAGYFLGVAYGVTKGALDRFTADAAVELNPHGVAVVSLWPAAVKTGTTRGLEQAGLVDLERAESPELTGRAVAALLGDPDVIRRSGSAFFVAALAHEYGFTEPDGTMPDLPDYADILQMEA